jgi:hypothetical protein
MLFTLMMVKVSTQDEVLPGYHPYSRIPLTILFIKVLGHVKIRAFNVKSAIGSCGTVAFILPSISFVHQRPRS